METKVANIYMFHCIFFDGFVAPINVLGSPEAEGGRVQIFGNNVNKSKFYSGRN